MLGNAGQKISRMVDLAETLYEKVVELREEVQALRETTRETRDRVADLETEVAGQRALLEALAEAEGLDVESIRAAAEAEEGESAAASSGAGDER
ncbi:MAG: DUF5798 family protein [Halobacteriales archaeon]|nr:DUF5798 family protein [Halobacteriales archaeon]